MEELEQRGNILEDLPQPSSSDPNPAEKLPRDYDLCGDPEDD